MENMDERIFHLLVDYATSNPAIMQPGILPSWLDGHRVRGLQIITEELNLGQAIVMRLRTHRGELAELGHSRYGSRLYELIGEPNTERTRELARQYSRECILQEPRVREIVSLQVEPSRDDINRINIIASVMPIGKSTICVVKRPTDMFAISFGSTDQIAESVTSAVELLS